MKTNDAILMESIFQNMFFGEQTFTVYSRNGVELGSIAASNENDAEKKAKRDYGDFAIIVKTN